MGTAAIGDSIRLDRIGRQCWTAYRPALAVILLGTAIAAGMTAVWAAPTRDEQSPTFATPVPSTDQLVSIGNVQPGRESVSLSARLTEKSLNPLNDVRWTVKTVGGETLIETKTSEVQAELPPGDYTVTATYGFKTITEPLTLPEGSRLNVSYVLNTGILRVLPRIRKGGFAALPSASRIYSLEGDVRGQLVTSSSIPGEVLSLPSGSYRIESSFAAGNALAVVDVKVKPGIQTAVDVDHVASIVKLSAPNTIGTVAWQISASDGSFSSEMNGSRAELALQPGTYIAVATTALQRYETTITVTDGETLEIEVGK